MDEHRQDNMAADNEAAEAQETVASGQESYTPRPLLHRVLAWMGIVYTILLSVLMAAFMMRGDYLRGIGRLMMIPALVACGVYLLLAYRKEHRKGGLALLVVCEGILLYLIGSGLADGIPALVAQLT